MRLPSAVVSSYTLIATGELKLFVFIGLVAMMVLVTAAVISWRLRATLGRRLVDETLGSQHLAHLGAFVADRASAQHLGDVVLHFRIEVADDRADVWLQQPCAYDDQGQPEEYAH